MRRDGSRRAGRLILSSPFVRLLFLQVNQKRRGGRGWLKQVKMRVRCGRRAAPIGSWIELGERVWRGGGAV